MKILNVKPTEDLAQAREELLAVLSEGGVAVFPTDTVYGIGANALDDTAVQEIYDIKQRSLAKALPIFVRDIEQARTIAEISPDVERFIQKIWPGSVTVVLPKKDVLSDLVTASQQTVGVRIPNNDFMLNVLSQLAFPLAVTSANISGMGEVTNLSQVLEDFRKQDIMPDIVIDMGDLPPSPPSTIIDVTQMPPVILREGAVSGDRLISIFNDLVKY